MSVTNANSGAAVLERFYRAEEAYMSRAGGFDAVAEALHPDCVIYQPASLPYGGEWRGHDGFERWLGAFRAQGSALAVRGFRLFDTHDGGIVFSMSHVSATARATGELVDWPLLQVFKLRDGLIAEVRPFHWDTAAMLPELGWTSPT